MSAPKKNPSALTELRARLAIAEETLAAIRNGEVDALLVGTTEKEEVFTLQGADKPYRLLIEAMNEGALTALPDGTILYCNRRFAAMVGRDMDKIMGDSLPEMVSQEQQLSLRTSLKALPASGCKAEFILKATPESAGLPVQLSLNSLDIAGVAAVAIVATDLTERKQHEASLLRQNEELEQRVEQRTADLSSLNVALQAAQEQLQNRADDLERAVMQRTSQLQESVKSLEEFCYTIAHDLRAPLRAMHGFGNALLNDGENSLGELERDYAGRIVKAASRMDVLIRDLLAYGRLNSAEVPLIPTDPVSLLQECIATCNSAQAKFRIESIPRVMANPIGLKQIFENLIGNAIKFVHTGVNPEIHIFCEQRDGMVRINIKDNGIGIEPHYHARIFRVFERLSPDQFGGTGIGLAIVQKGIERMQGKVGLESSPGNGSCFWLELPAAA